MGQFIFFTGFSCYYVIRDYPMEFWTYSVVSTRKSYLPESLTLMAITKTLCYNLFITFQFTVFHVQHTKM